MDPFQKGPTPGSKAAVQLLRDTIIYRCHDLRFIYGGRRTGAKGLERVILGYTIIYMYKCGRQVILTGKQGEDALLLFNRRTARFHDIETSF